MLSTLCLSFLPMTNIVLTITYTMQQLTTFEEAHKVLRSSFPHGQGGHVII